MDVVQPGFGDTFVSARAVIDDMEEGMNVKMQYKVVGDPNGVDYTPVEEMRAATMNEVEQKSGFVKFIFSMIAHILTFTFLIVFKSAYNYNGKYLTDVGFDNIYITRYFKHIDARRRAQGKKTLLPLKKFERRDIIDPMKISAFLRI
ncbi:DC-STAMP domain-containing protein 1 [Plakobranchus ocellatus]|uniref:DC-STAMP domain-containing protein 1 n=1 Tax=Plakobranchus ocellatus TaxID=259542 RepID=A0AAV4C9S0_9GAST|nr:DC-STAMP domain-containing protein 1 [Plakobranchus ocellatus]